MELTKSRILILIVITVIAFILGRLAFRTFLNILLGGTLFGGNLFWIKRIEKEEKLCL